MSQPLFKDLKVIELASVLAGPSVGQFFAELGAEVIKIEPPTGDVTRSWKLSTESPSNTRPAYFTAINWGKTSLLLDLKEKPAKDKLYELVKTADIVIASYKPGDAQKLGVDYSSLLQYNPKLIYGSISGYGSTDPRVGYDAIIQAEAGFLYINGRPESPPIKMPVALMDVLAAHQLKEALLLALFKRERFNEGSEVEVSLFDAAVAALSNQATNWLNAGHLPQRMGSGHPNIVPYGDTFPTKDQSLILLAVGTDRQFEKLCQVLGIDVEERFKTNALRVQHREEITSLIAHKIIKWPSSEILEKLNKNQIPAGRVNNMEQVFEMPHTQTLLMEADGLKGIKQFVGKGLRVEKALAAPPKLSI